jgi:hypothetical protein
LQFYAAVKHRYHDVAFNALSVMRMHGSLPPAASLTELAAGTADVDNVPCALAALKAFADKDKVSDSAAWPSRLTGTC